MEEENREIERSNQMTRKDTQTLSKKEALERISTWEIWDSEERRLIMKLLNNFYENDGDVELNDVLVSIESTTAHHLDMTTDFLTEKLFSEKSKDILCDTTTPSDIHNKANTVAVELNAHLRDEAGKLIKKEETSGDELTKGLRFLYSSEQPLTKTDYYVMIAVNTLYNIGNTYITPSMIYRTIHGITDGTRVSNNQINTIKESMEKMRHVFCTLNYSNQAKQHHIIPKKATQEQLDSCIIDDYLLSFAHAKKVIHGQLVDAYEIHTQPMLCRYSEHIKQITRVDAKALDIHKNGKRLPMTETRTVLANYIVKRISIMKGKTKQKPIICYNTVLEQLTPYTKKRPTELTRAERQRTYDTIIDILNHEKAVGFITDFKEIKGAKGKREKVEIIL